MIDIIEVLDKANEEVSEKFKAYCLEMGFKPKEVCVSAKAKGIRKYFVSQLFNEDLTPCASPESVQRSGKVGGAEIVGRASVSRPERSTATA